MSGLLEQKNRLAYDKGKLQTRVDQLQAELESLGDTKAELAKLTRHNSELENKYKKVTMNRALFIFVCLPYFEVRDLLLCNSDSLFLSQIKIQCTKCRFELRFPMGNGCVGLAQTLTGHITGSLCYGNHKTKLKSSFCPTIFLVQFFPKSGCYLYFIRTCSCVLFNILVLHNS